MLGVSMGMMRVLSSSRLLDEKHPAENLLAGNITGGKWLISASKIVTSMTATFQLAERCVISSVHIGNSGSAFVSLLVSRTGCSEFKDLLPCSALMTLQESKTGQNKNSVKMYVKDDFLGETKGGKWDQLRVVVTQPFNHQMQFGLCFLRVFSFLEEDVENTNVNSDLFSKWEKMRSQINNSLSPASSKLTGQRLSGPLSRSDRILLQAGQQPNELEGKEKTTIRAKYEDIDESFLEASILSFMESLNLQDKDLDNVQLIDVQEKMERIQGREFSSQEKHIFITVVKKYVRSLKRTKSTEMVESQNSGPSIEMKHCSKQESVKPKLNTTVNLSHQSYSVKKKQISVKESDRENKSCGTSMLSTEASTSKTSRPLGRRNLISLEDSGHTNEGMPHNRGVSVKLVGGEKCFTNNDSRETSDCITQQNSKKVLKRKLSESEDSNRKYQAIDSDKLGITDNFGVSELEEDNIHSDHTTGEDLIACPICKVYFEADVIENHAAGCVSFAESEVTEDPVIQEVECPLCSKRMSSEIVDIHANMCASQMFGD